MINLESITQDPGILKKLLIGGVLALTGIGMIVVLGWGIEATRRNMHNPNAMLPDWDDFGKYTLDGLKAAGIGIIWSLPIVVLVIVLAAAVILFAPGFASEEDAAMMVVIANLCMVLLALAYTIPVGLLSAPAFGILAETDDFKAALNPKAAYEIFKANPGGFVMALLFTVLVSFILGIIGVVLCMIGIYPAAALSYGIMGQLYGNAYGQAKAQMADMEPAA